MYNYSLRAPRAEHPGRAYFRGLCNSTIKHNRILHLHDDNYSNSIYLHIGPHTIKSILA